MRRDASLGLLLVCLVQLACRGARPPVSPLPVNAVLSDPTMIYGHSDPGHRGHPGDTQLTARCRSSDTFAKRQRGDWVTHWYRVCFDVVTVDRGTWPDPELSFICSARTPTLESGIMLDIPPWPYMPGKMWIFELNTGSHPASIVAQYAPFNPGPGTE